MTPANERKEAERQRKKAAGLVRLEIWAPTTAHDAIRQAAEKIVTALQTLPEKR